MIKRIVTTRNLREKTYEKIRDFLIGNEVPPGAKINEDALARALGVSKTPVREALAKLAHDGLVEIVPNRGAYKVKLSKEDIVEIMLIREALEGLCIRLAAKNVTAKVIQKLKSMVDEFDEKDLDENLSRYPEADLKFHKLIYDLSKSPRLIRLIQNYFYLTHMLRLQYFRNPERVRLSLKGHRELISALEKRDGELAEKVLKKIMRSVCDYLTEKVSEKTSFQKGKEGIRWQITV